MYIGDIQNERKIMMQNVKEIIKVGAVFKNYKQLCETLGEEVMKGGKQKSLQLEEWSDYFTWERDGYKFIITDVKDDLFVNINNIDNRSSQILTLTQLTICEMVISEIQKQHNTKEVLISSSAIAEKIGYVNELYSEYIQSDKYFLARDIINRYPNENAVNKKGVETYDIMKVIDEAYNKVGRSFKQRITNSLEKLRQEKILYIESVRYVTTYDMQDVDNSDSNEYTFKKNKLNKKSGVQEKKNKVFVLNAPREATQDEKQFILDIEGKVLSWFGKRNQSELIAEGLIQKYREKVDEELLNSNRRIYNYFDMYKITPSSRYLDEKIDSLYEDIAELSHQFQESMIQNKENLIKSKIAKSNNIPIEEVTLTTDDIDDKRLFEIIIKTIVDKDDPLAIEVRDKKEKKKKGE